MSAEDRTSVFEMRERADMSDFWGTAEQLIRSEAFEEHPHRDLDKLQAAIKGAESVEEARDELGVSSKAVSKWCDVYGLESPTRHQDSMAAKLSNLDASEV